MTTRYSCPRRQGRLRYDHLTSHRRGDTQKKSLSDFPRKAVGEMSAARNALARHATLLQPHRQCDERTSILGSLRGWWTSHWQLSYGGLGRPRHRW